jgi:methylated-DNA-[protein]-cysteine S-methyltransferase
VGGALGRNRLPIIIPCHRVVSKEGDLGGFSAGVEMKVLLLKIEGALLC